MMLRLGDIQRTGVFMGWRSARHPLAKDGEVLWRKDASGWTNRKQAAMKNQMEQFTTCRAAPEYGIPACD
jgi:hypothetical protein